MLKLNYTDIGLHIEPVTKKLEELIAERVLLAVRLGQSLYVEPGIANILLLAETEAIAQLERSLRQEEIYLSLVDKELVEMTIQGTWIAETVDSHEGTLITAFNEQTESLILKMWQSTHESLSQR